MEVGSLYLLIVRLKVEAQVLVVVGRILLVMIVVIIAVAIIIVVRENVHRRGSLHGERYVVVHLVDRAVLDATIVPVTGHACELFNVANFGNHNAGLIM